MDLLVFGVGALLASYLLVVLALGTVRTIGRAWPHVRGAFTAPLSTHVVYANREARMRQIEDELRRAFGQADAWGSQERADIVDAALAAQDITVLNQRLRQTVNQCLATHWAVAQGLGTADMAEAARHPWCNGLRRRVIDLSDVLSQRLEQYPLILDAPELIRLQLGIRWIAPTCATCPYWTSTVQDAPRICPTAKAIGHGAASSRHRSTVDAEILEAGDGDPK
jgi:hypothetical protein